MSTVSAIIVTRHPSERVVELLGAVRGGVDEVVVVVDDRAGAAGLGALETLADTVALFRFRHAIERQWEWITSLATSEWILWLDDDELPSASLVSSLRDLVEAPDVTHYELRRHWIWPDVSSRLAEPPWEPDFQPRLYRADKALVWYPGILHVPVRQLGPFRWVDAPLFHVDLVLNAEVSRRKKVRRYERLRPGLRLAGRAQNDAVYLPEGRIRAPVTAPVSSDDRAAIERFVGCSADPIDDAPATRPVVHGTREVVESVYRGVSDAPVDDAALEVVGSVEPMYAGVERSLEVRVENRGSDWWPPHGFMVSDVFVSYRWYASDGSVAVDGGLRTPIQVGVPPGGRELVVIDVIPPDVEGRYVLGVDLVREHVHWFSCEQRVDVDVGRVPVVAVLVDPDDVASALQVARVLTDVVPEAQLELLARDPASTSAATGYPAGLDPRIGALESRPLGLLVGAIRPGGRRRTSGAKGRFDVVVIAGGSRLAGSAGRRESLALATIMRRLARQGVPVVAVGTRSLEPPDLVGRMATRALSLVDRQVEPGDDEALGAAVSQMLQHSGLL